LLRVYAIPGWGETTLKDTQIMPKIL
jgi:hypothetical protein